MKYRVFNKLEKPVSLLGMGCMRLPVINGNNEAIDEAAAIALIRKAIDSGVNYVDTAYMYHGGNGEGVVGKALRDGYREKVYLADKMPVWFARNGKTLEDVFRDQLNRLQVDFIDLYLAHNLNEKYWKMAEEQNLFEFMRRKQEEGQVGLIGFSFHDELPLFKKIVDAYPWDFCQIQLNYMDEHYQAGVEGMKYAAGKGLPVVVMEPLKGGRLTDNIPKEVQNRWNCRPEKRTPAEWGFRWVADFPEVTTILSGISNEEQLEENLRIFDGLEACSMTGDEKKLISEVAEEYRRRIRYSCTGCKYCDACPKGLDIPGAIDIYNDGCLYGDESVRSDLAFVAKEKKPDQCTKCGMCEEKCPQHLPIRRILDGLARIIK